MNLDALLARAAFRTKREVEELVVSLRPRPAPAPGIRKLPANVPTGEHGDLAFDVRAAELGAAPTLNEPSETAPEIAACTAQATEPRTAPVERRRARSWTCSAALALGPLPRRHDRRAR